MTVHGDCSADASRTVDPFDPVALEARLAAARLRRSSVLAERSASRDASPPAPAATAAAPPRPTLLGRLPWLASGRVAAVLAGIVAGTCLVLPLGLALSPAPPPPAATPSPAPAALAVAAPVAAAPPPVAAAAPAAPPAEAALRPAPRPSGHRVASVPGPATRSARNAPRQVTPPQAVRMAVRDLNAFTIGSTARALGVRERVAVPGVPLAVTIDRRGLRLHERRLRQRRR
jgi:hypothetical protein